MIKKLAEYWILIAIPILLLGTAWLCDNVLFTDDLDYINKEFYHAENTVNNRTNFINIQNQLLNIDHIVSFSSAIDYLKQENQPEQILWGINIDLSTNETLTFYWRDYQDMLNVLLNVAHKFNIYMASVDEQGHIIDDETKWIVPKEIQLGRVTAEKRVFRQSKYKYYRKLVE